jgi:putative SOS response-associated peptidase YedK
MCGRYAFSPDADIKERFNLKSLPPTLFKNYNSAPGQFAQVIINNPAQIVTMKWGITPAWSKNPIGIINTRSDSLASKNFYQPLLSQYRCLIPINGFYEWQVNGSQKKPYYFFSPNNKYLALAGIYQNNSFSIITVNPNSVVSQVHSRMPAILRQEDEFKWLSLSGKTELLSLVNSFPSDSLSFHQVSHSVNTVSNNSPDQIDKI